ncbi:MFS transporter [Serratia fonticola]|uniref:MFS transporter n=1 Tax=Serratia fonticola TaxID=47917 RepID=A0A559TB72_SERFO|nr:MFS transporter [Serratia fonticola]TQI97368.1 MFS transporter [Serratia fonticola]TVZ71864.1 MFS transporter [Serratia fonticola]
MTRPLIHLPSNAARIASYFSTPPARAITGFSGCWRRFTLVNRRSSSLLLLRNVGQASHKTELTPKEKLRELSRAVTILFTNSNIFLSCLIRIINTLSLFGFAVFMPMLFVGRLGFTMSEWLQIWAVFFFVTIFTNIMWGILGEKIGWLRQVRWFGCVGCAISSLAFYYLPVHFGHNFWIALIPAVLLGITVAAFVPMTVVFPVLEPNHKGAAISIYNLSAGLSNFVAPAIASMVLPFFDIEGVVWVYTGLYLVATVLTLVVKVDQPGHNNVPRYVLNNDVLAKKPLQ